MFILLLDDGFQKISAEGSTFRSFVLSKHEPLITLGLPLCLVLLRLALLHLSVAVWSNND